MPTRERWKRYAVGSPGEHRYRWELWLGNGLYARVEQVKVWVSYEGRRRGGREVLRFEAIGVVARASFDDPYPVVRMAPKMRYKTLSAAKEACLFEAECVSKAILDQAVRSGYEPKLERLRGEHGKPA